MGLARRDLAIGAAGVAIASAGYLTAARTDVLPVSSETRLVAAAPSMSNCNDWVGGYTQRECFAAGTLLTSLANMQGAAQFCKWRAANPGEWSRLHGYASSGTLATGIVTWFGAHVLNDLQAYFAAGGPPFVLPPNTAPNACRTPLAPPQVTGVTPGQTDVTVTVGPGG